MKVYVGKKLCHNVDCGQLSMINLDLSDTESGQLSMINPDLSDTDSG